VQVTAGDRGIEMQVEVRASESESNLTFEGRSLVGVDEMVTLLVDGAVAVQKFKLKSTDKFKEKVKVKDGHHVVMVRWEKA
jgi:hypothetical protein